MYQDRYAKTLISLSQIFFCNTMPDLFNREEHREKT